MEVRCARCHRVLKDEDSKKRGMGETCAARSGLVIAKAKKNFVLKVKLKKKLTVQKLLFSIENIKEILRRNELE